MPGRITHSYPAMVTMLGNLAPTNEDKQASYMLHAAGGSGIIKRE